MIQYNLFVKVTFFFDSLVYLFWQQIRDMLRNNVANTKQLFIVFISQIYRVFPVNHIRGGEIVLLQTDFGNYQERMHK